MCTEEFGSLRGRKHYHLVIFAPAELRYRHLHNTYKGGISEAKLIKETPRGAFTYVAKYLLKEHSRVRASQFRHPNRGEAAEEANSMLHGAYRPSQFVTSVIDAADFAEGTIDTSGATATTQDIRKAFAAEKWEMMREYYGDKYVDYLAQVGVKANWSVSEQPELIGKSNSDLSFVLSKGTGSSTTTLGELGGVFQGTLDVPARRTFCAEHGLIATYAMVRMELLPVAKAGPPVLSKIAHDTYWNPVDEIEVFQLWPKELFGSTAAMHTAKYEDYRKGESLLGRIAANAYQHTTATALTDDTIVSPPASRWDSIFAGTLGTPASGDHIQYNSKNRYKKESPVKPAKVRQQAYV